MEIKHTVSVVHDDGYEEQIELIGSSTYTIPDPVQAPVFQDNFNYIVNKTDTDADQTFIANGWSGAKTMQVPGQEGAGAYLYTTDTIPGFTGQFPGINSTRVLAIETDLNAYGQDQTDVWLSLAGGDETIPGDVWFQFWIMPTGDYYSRSKWLYPCNGIYPCSYGENGSNWMAHIATASDGPYNEYTTNPANDIYMAVHDTINAAGPDAVIPGVDPDLAWKLGHSDTSEKMISNRWTLVKMHINTSTTSGSYEAWMKPQGGQWTKTADFRDGATVDWTVSRPGGHRNLRWPTTINSTIINGSYVDSITYIDDFIISDSEDGLPVY